MGNVAESIAELKSFSSTHIHTKKHKLLPKQKQTQIDKQAHSLRLSVHQRVPVISLRIIVILVIL